jgi:hypothetical protein
MPVNSAPIAARLGKPSDLRHPIADRDQKLPTVSVATQANTRDFAKWHIDYAAHPAAGSCSTYRFSPWELPWLFNECAPAVSPDRIAFDPAGQN